jgi:hypothetical protein
MMGAKVGLLHYPLKNFPLTAILSPRGEERKF